MKLLDPQKLTAASYIGIFIMMAGIYYASHPDRLAVLMTDLFGR
jgi:hypothetical protein